MVKHLTPTERRLIITAEKKGRVEVRTIRTQRAGQPASETINAYEANALHNLQKRGRVQIMRRYEWTSSLTNLTILGTTFVAKLAT